MKIGIISENYHHDSKALKVLLEQRFKSAHTFIPILKKVKGTKVFNSRNIDLINTISKKKQLNLIILAKDLDAAPSNQKAIEAIQRKSNVIKKGIVSDYLLFIIIFELEALILADFSTFKNIYKIKQNYNKSPIHEIKPKETLAIFTRNSKRKYDESQVVEIFQQLNFQKIYQNHKGENSFQSFIKELENTLN